MRKDSPSIIAFGVFFLFLIQLAGILVESIYILDLMNTSLDEKALGVLFFFSPLLLFLFRKKLPSQAIWLIFGLLFISRGLTPYLNTLGRMIVSGIGIGSALLLLPAFLTAKPKGESQSDPGLPGSAGLALAVGLSVLFRTANYSLDLSLTPSGGWIGWGLGLLLGWSLTRLTWEDEPTPLPSKPNVGSLVMGIYLILTLVYFTFSAPAVIARWTQGNYVLIVLAVSLLSLLWTWLVIGKSDLLEKFTPQVLLIWNVIFAASLTATILAHRVAFPPTPESPAVVIGNPTWLQQIPLLLILLSFPVIFLDLRIFLSTLQVTSPSPRQLASGMLLGSLALVLLIFISIFINVWGYVEPVSTPFRNQFHLPYLLTTVLLTLLVWRDRSPDLKSLHNLNSSTPMGWNIALVVIFLATVLFSLRTEKIQPAETKKNSFVVMTYNIQQANDDFGERSADGQLALIRQVSPDILALQESDSARISLNNNDYVRYYAGKLGYYSYYGPATVTGTFGTAILSKYPLENPRTVFTFSDVDEIGTSEAEINMGGRVFTIYNVHPDGSDTAMLVFAERLLERTQGKANVIILGDFNLRDNEQPFQLIAEKYTNAWTSVYPSKISTDGVDMSGRNRIDHIFFSPELTAQNPVYVLPPDSATDHPVHWAEISWK